MATPRGGSKFFRAMGQSAASRGESCAGVTLLATAALHARTAFLDGYHSQRGHNRPRSQYLPSADDIVDAAKTRNLGETQQQAKETYRALTAHPKLGAIKAAHAAGMSIRACAKEFGVAESTIRGWLKKEGA